MNTAASSPHIPVLLNEVLTALNIHEEKSYIDATFGCGGYSRALLQKNARHVTAFDRDPAAFPHAEALEKEFHPRFTFHHDCFSRMASYAAPDSQGGIVFDLGVSSPQLDIPERGFSFRFNGALDMRMSQEGQTAAEAVNTLSETELADIIYTYGEERFARKIAKAICTDRVTTPFTTTDQLAGLVRRLVKKSKDGIDPATRTFQALRIYVNNEMEELEKGLQAALSLLEPEGRLAVVSFHSLEDRITKKTFKEYSGAENISRHLPPLQQKQPLLRLVQRKSITASEQEEKSNPRARSARLRVAEKLPLTPNNNNNQRYL